MIYSLECIDTGKIWPVYTVRLRALGRRACNIEGTAWNQAINNYMHTETGVFDSINVAAC